MAHEYRVVNRTRFCYLRLRPARNDFSLDPAEWKACHRWTSEHLHSADEIYPELVRPRTCEPHKESRRSNTQAAASLLSLKKASNSELISSFRVETIPCGAPWITFNLEPLTSFDERRAEAAIGTIWSSSP